MEIILKKDVENLGLEFDTVSVKPGYARNFLIPQGLAVLATPKNRAELAATLEASNSIKRVGKFSAKIRLHRDVEHEYEFDVVSDAPAAPAKKEEAKSEEA